ncbi:3-hydroxyacyl-CoA dehydrogenase OS=Castellaniella defragrans OX=75697 GN=HNR28_000737 PE=3 SV=1 [Castellaniella defragrans]
MQEPVVTRREGDVLVVTVDHPPVNALSVAVRHGLAEAIALAGRDATIAAVLILGEGSHFIAGADIREFGRPPQEPFLNQVCHQIEACAKLVVAALHGSVLGGGLEVALAAHYRIAAPDARLGLPEVTLGLLPGAGGTQRLPRLIGAQAALDLMLGGRPLAAEPALSLHLVDRLSPSAEALTGQALDYVRELLAAGTGPRRTRDASGMSDAAASRLAIGAAREAQRRKAPQLLSPHRIVDAVQGALELSFDEGLKLERRFFLECMDSPQRAGLVHAFFAERETAKVPEAAAGTVRALDALGVVGGGTMGAGIAVAALKAGLQVRMVERDEPGLARGEANVRKILDGLTDRGRLAAKERDACLTRFSGSTDYASLAAADLVIEGANVVHEGIALRPLDVDVVLMHGYGFPRHHGGPMHYADTVGLPAVLADIRAYARDDPLFWQPSPLLERLVEQGRGFASLNRT